MGFKEKIMEGMMNKMSSEEKKEMMDKMMEKFFSGMTDEEKKEMMKEMMPKMTKQMMGGGSMMEMMGMMMGKDEDKENFNPMEMCQKMMSSIGKSSEMATFATPEVRGLFEEWVQQIDEEILNFIKEKNTTDPEQIAAHLKISKNSVIYFLSRLAQKGKISLKVDKEK